MHAKPRETVLQVGCRRLRVAPRLVPPARTASWEAGPRSAPGPPASPQSDGRIVLIAEVILDEAGYLLVEQRGGLGECRRALAPKRDVGGCSVSISVQMASSCSMIAGSRRVASAGLPKAIRAWPSKAASIFARGSSRSSSSPNGR